MNEPVKAQELRDAADVLVRVTKQYPDRVGTRWVDYLLALATDIEMLDREQRDRIRRQRARVSELVNEMLKVSMDTNPSSHRALLVSVAESLIKRYPALLDTEPSTDATP